MSKPIVSLFAQWPGPDGEPVPGHLLLCDLGSPVVAAWCRHLWDEDGPTIGVVRPVLD